MSSSHHLVCHDFFIFSTIFQLEEGNGRKWFYDLGSKKALSSNQLMWKKKENVAANTECATDEIIFLRGEFDRMKRTAEEQARSIIEDMTSKKFEETSQEIEEMSQKFEELRSLVANPSENSDQR